MSEYRFVLRCPYCDESFEAGQPDKWHSEYSFEAPIMENHHGTVVRNKYICRNPKCKRSIEVYWYSAMEYFNTM